VALEPQRRTWRWSPSGARGAGALAAHVALERQAHPRQEHKPEQEEGLVQQVEPLALAVQAVELQDLPHARARGGASAARSDQRSASGQRSAVRPARRAPPREVEETASLAGSGGGLRGSWNPW